MHFTAALVGIMPLLAQAELPKPAAWENLDFIAGRLNSLPRIGARISPWTSGYINEPCYRYAKEKGLDTKQFKAFTIFMDDCDIDPWIICRQNGAKGSIEETVAAFARIPVGIRQWIGDITHFKDGAGGSAPGHDVTLSGGSGSNTATMIHEGMHIVDWTGAMGEFMHAQGDKSRDWHAAYNKDSHVADNYARNNHVENFAQYAGLIIYDRVTNKKLQNDFPVKYKSIVEQIRAQGQAADKSGMMFALANSGRKCTRHWPMSVRVDPATGEEKGPIITTLDTSADASILSAMRVNTLAAAVDPAIQALLDLEPGLTTPVCAVGGEV